jgi:lactose/L-arabinose transport system permease protein
MSFIKWNGMGRKSFIGLENYIALFHDKTYIAAIRNTLILWLINIVLVIFTGFVFSLILNSKSLPFKGFFRTCLYLPQALAVVPLCLVFAYMFEYNFGFFNLLLHKLNLSSVEWLLNPNNALTSIIGTLVWRTAPWHMVILLAGLQGIPGELYEAAGIDGCNYFQRVIRITVPLLKPIFFYCFLVGTISSFQVFQEPYVITAGGPGTATTTISLYMYRSAFEFFKLGYASAITFISLFIIMILSVVILIGFRSEL